MISEMVDEQIHKDAVHKIGIALAFVAVIVLALLAVPPMLYYGNLYVEFWLGK